MPDCLFCKIAAGVIPVKPIYEDDRVIAFPDINPQAPTHILVIPRQHIASTADAEPGHADLLGHLLTTAARIAATQNLHHGYRIVINTGDDGGQTVPHLHLHLLGGRHMTWPPG